MKEFPQKLKPKYRHLFPQIEFNKLLENWREKTFNYILSNDKNVLDLCDKNNTPVDKRIINCLRLELSVLGWKTQLAYNGTLLFIYENEKEVENYKHVFSEDVFE